MHKQSVCKHFLVLSEDTIQVTLSNYSFVTKAYLNLEIWIKSLDNLKFDCIRLHLTNYESFYVSYEDSFYEKTVEGLIFSHFTVVCVILKNNLPQCISFHYLEHAWPILLMQHLEFYGTFFLITQKAPNSCIIDPTRLAEMKLLYLHLPAVTFC